MPNELKPTNEQIDAAEKIVVHEGCPHYHGCLKCFEAERVAIILATRDSRIIAEARAGAVRRFAEIYGIDGHQWSRRPCDTCQKIMNEFGVPWGCIAYAAAERAKTADKPKEGN